MLRPLLLLAVIGVALARKDPFYRKDYRYFYEFDAFYKFHWNAGVSSWLDAFIKCSDEGANLFYPSVDGEFVVVTNLTGSAPDYNASDIFVGIHDEFHVGEYITVDGSSTPYPILQDKLRENKGRGCVLLDIETGEYRVENCAAVEIQEGPDGILAEVPVVDTNKGFICKKTKKPTLCPTIDEGYSYSKVTRKCYKVINKHNSWNEAFEHCYMEGAILFVPENDEEYQEVIDKHIRSNERRNNNFYGPNGNNYNNNQERSYFIGIHQLIPGPPTENLYTAKGVPLEEGGAYQYWNPNENYEGRSFPSQSCVAIGHEVNNDGVSYFNTKPCYTRLPFVCEMKANS